jgi:hypothetical protein
VEKIKTISFRNRVRRIRRAPRKSLLHCNLYLTYRDLLCNVIMPTVTRCSTLSGSWSGKSDVVVYTFSAAVPVDALPKPIWVRTMDELRPRP